MFHPPVNRVMRQLDRSFFQKSIKLAAATVFDTQRIAPIKSQLSKTSELCTAPRLIPVRPAPLSTTELFNWDLRVEKKESARRKDLLKCILLDEKVRPDDNSTWSPTIKELVNAKSMEVQPYNMLLDYNYWTYEQIINSILPEDQVEESPVGFQIVGHIAHFNLREEYRPYRHLIARVLIDKQANIRTVINKVDEVGSHNEYRTFDYELLDGDPDMKVTVKEQECMFTFDYSKVYWNSRLGTEHTRMCETFQQGQAICDVMAGVGPFAIPSGKKRAFVWANDINPHGYDCLVENSHNNKVDKFVNAHNMDGREFIRRATRTLAMNAPQVAHVPVKHKLSFPSTGYSPGGTKAVKVSTKRFQSPRTFDHYIMNLPASAIEFLTAFRGISAGHETLFSPYTKRRLPMIHVYCFSSNSEDEATEHADICRRISESLGFEITPADMHDSERELSIRWVRLVSPTKQMFCASFRAPREVIFAERKD